MTTPDLHQKQMTEALKQLNPDELAISAYSRTALGRTLKAAEFYMDIYRSALEKCVAAVALPPSEITLVDYGGGHGLLSILAKQMDFGRVIYIDMRAESLQTVQTLGERLGTLPDVMLQGDADMLQDWCERNQERPTALLAMDVIEHVYILDEFFATLHRINPAMWMLFTTASTPYNKRVVKRLHKAMILDELGNDQKKGFRTLRREYIQQLHPDMPERMLDLWAEQTRGLIYYDVKRAVESQSPNLLRDPYNTCDPESGSWTERILPIEEYRQLLAPYHYRLTVLPGFYNEHRRGPKEWMSHHYNMRIAEAPDHEPENLRERHKMRKALKVAPFLFLIVDRKEEEL